MNAEELVVDGFGENPYPYERREMKDETKSDGCTGFPDGYWRRCCVHHDKAYAPGGTWRERYWADRIFRDCVWVMVYREKDSALWADAQSLFMYYGVRVFGSPWCLPLYLWPRWRKRARWGYGR